MSVDIFQSFFEFIREIEQWDKSCFLQLNALHNDFFDGFMFWITDKFVWIPLYISIIYVIIKNKKHETLLIAIGIILTIVFADQFASGFCKPLFERLRPSHDPSIDLLVHTVRGDKGDLYGFISSHAANTFGLAMFTALLFKNTWYSFMIFMWAILNSYSRIYLGVHFPIDILFGALSGVFIAWMFYALYLLLKKKLPQYRYSIHKTNIRTNVDYPQKDLRIVFLTMLTTLFFIMLFASKNIFAY